MLPQQEHDLLLRDALDRVITNPNASQCWHRLLPLYIASSQEHKLTITQSLLRNLPADGLPGFLRATFLASVNGDLRYLADAATSVLNLRPFDSDRAMTFLHYAWAKIIPHAAAHTDFVRSLKNALFPQLVQTVSNDLSDRFSTRPVQRVVNKATKVAIIAPQMSAQGHAPTRMALDQAAILIKSGIQVELFCCQEQAIVDVPALLGAAEWMNLPGPDAIFWSTRLESSLTIRLADTRLSLVRRWAQILESITAFDPDVVLLVGLYSPLMAPLYQSRPVIGLSVHAIAPIAPVDVWLCADRSQAGQINSLWSPAMPECFAFHHPYRIRLTSAGKPVERQTLEIPAGAVVLVTLGYRLDSEIQGEWAEAMIQVLERYPDVVWLLVGGGGAIPPALASVPSRRLRVLPHQADPAALLNSSDIFVNPPRIGGGFSVAEAMAASLPVVTFAGSDGGDKAGSAASRDRGNYFAMLTRLIENRTLREETGKAMRARFTAMLDLDHSGPSLIAACEVAIERFNQRVSRCVS